MALSSGSGGAHGDGEQRPGGAQGVSIGDIREERFKQGDSLCKGPGAGKAWHI